MIEAPGCLRVWYHPPQALVSSGGLLGLEPRSLLPQRAGLERGTKFCLATTPTSVPKWVLPYRCHRAQLRVVATGFPSQAPRTPDGSSSKNQPGGAQDPGAAATS